MPGESQQDSRRQHPRIRLDDNFASAIRFSLMASLADDIEMDFPTLAQVLQVGDSALSKAISHLHDVNYVVASKSQVNARLRTTVRSTPLGRDAFAAHLRALREIVELGGQRL